MTEELKDERVSLEGLDPVAALRALLAVDPEAPPADNGKPEPERTDGKPGDE